MRPIDAIDCGLWLTPTTRDYKDSPGMSLAPRRDGASRTDLLPRQVYATMRALWATPTASADKAIRTPAGARREVERDRSPDLAAQTLALWPTPTSLAPPKDDYNGAGNSAGLVAIRRIALGLGVALGTTATGSSATTASCAGSLDPAFVFWLMGYPRAFLDCAPQATRSSRSLRRKSSVLCAKDDAA
jgi:hypothetical protein